MGQVCKLGLDQILHWLLTVDSSAKRQPILADEVQSFKALITVHKVLQEGYPIAVREAQANTSWLDSLTRGVSGEGLRGTELRKPKSRGRSSVSLLRRCRRFLEKADIRSKLWIVVARICILPPCKVGVPQTTSRIQRQDTLTKTLSILC